MPEEFALLTASFGATSAKTIGPREFFRAQAGGRELVFVCSRIGKVAAASTATTLIQSFGVDALLMTGVAGGVNARVKVGDVVVADALVQHDIDLKGVLGCRRFDIPLLNCSSLVADPHLSQVANDAARAAVRDPRYVSAVSGLGLSAAEAHSGVVASGDQFIDSGHERGELERLIPGLLAVEMEGAAAAQVCAEHGVPFAVSRVISDSADRHAPVDFVSFIQRAAAVGSERLVFEFVSRLP